MNFIGRAVRGIAVALLGASAAHGQTTPDASHTICVDVSVGSAQSYACLNEQLAAMAAGAKRSSAADTAPISATSPSNVTGTFNESATRNRLGSNFGKSVTPERPAFNASAGIHPH